ncbi:MAG: hypothetical protein ACYC5X_06390 [Syntrophales bacterium]
MPTQASQAALNVLWDMTMIRWYVIPLLSIVIYIYVTEMKKAREKGNWNAIFAGLTIFGMDFFNETWNGWVFHFYVAATLVIGMKTDQRKLLAIGLIYSVPVLRNVIGKGLFHWAY